MRAPRILSSVKVLTPTTAHKLLLTDAVSSPNNTSPHYKNPSATLLVTKYVARPLKSPLGDLCCGRPQP